MEWNLLGDHSLGSHMLAVFDPNLVCRKFGDTQPFDTDDHIFRWRSKPTCDFRIQSKKNGKKKWGSTYFHHRKLNRFHGKPQLWWFLWLASIHVSTRPAKHWAPWEDLTKRPWKQLGLLRGSGFNEGPLGKIIWVVSKKDLNNRGYFFCKKGGWKTSQLGRDYDKPL